MIQSPLSTYGSLPSAHMPQIHWLNFSSASQSANIFPTPGPLHMLFLLNTFPFSLSFTTLLPLIVLLDYICLAPPSSCCTSFLIFFFVSCTTHHSLQFIFSVSIRLSSSLAFNIDSLFSSNPSIINSKSEVVSKIFPSSLWRHIQRRVLIFVPVA